MRDEYRPLKFFVNLLDELFPHEEHTITFFRGFRSRFIWDRDNQRLECSYKVSDIAQYISERLRKDLLPP